MIWVSNAKFAKLVAWGSAICGCMWAGGLSLAPLASGNIVKGYASTNNAQPGPDSGRKANSAVIRYDFTEQHMGVDFRLLFYAGDPETANSAAKAAFARIAALDAMLSDYQEDSELSRLSQTSGQNRWVPVSSDLWTVLARAQDYAQLSDGAFDVTVGPYVLLWRRSRRQGTLPTPERLQKTAPSVGYSHMELDPAHKAIRLTQANMRLDLGGIAQGYAADAALAELKNFGISQALVDASGDISVGDAPPQEPAGWRIGIAPLDAKDGPPSRYLLLKNGSVSTSGDAWQYVEIDGTRYSHIVNPKSGLGLQTHSSVTIIAPDGMAADALATAVCVQGPQQGLQLLKDIPGAAGLIVHAEGDSILQTATDNFPADAGPPVANANANANANAAGARPALEPSAEAQWLFVDGNLHLTDGCLSNDRPESSRAFWMEHDFTQLRLECQLKIEGQGNGVRAAMIIFRAAGKRSYYWFHLDAKNRQVILVRSSPDNGWHEIARAATSKLDVDRWLKIAVEATGPKLSLFVDGEQVLCGEDATLPRGRIGFGTSEGQISVRDLSVQAAVALPPEDFADPLPPTVKLLSLGPAAGPYQAFCDACRLANGDIVCVFYAGYGHVSLPNARWPRGGRICLVRSTDDGRSWSQSQIAYDGPLDDRDPHIAQLADGTLICSFFEYESANKYSTAIVRSTDGGNTWEAQATPLASQWACSAPVRKLSDGTLLLGVYYADDTTAYGGVLRSADQGRTWSEPCPIQPMSPVRLDAETDVIELADGRIYAALRGDGNVHLHSSISADGGHTWSPVKDEGFLGHCPHLTRLSTGQVVLVTRMPMTELRVSHDDCQTWSDPYEVDHVIGAYPATVELRDGSLLVTYYEEGVGSSIRAKRLRLTADGPVELPFETP